jgi:hypothetical protein
MQVLNQVPKHNKAFRLACIFTSPSKEDGLAGQPFNDPNNGTFVRSYLAQKRIQPSDVFMGYLDQYVSNRPFNPTSDTAQISLAKLRQDLAEFKPNCILIFGAAGQRIAGGATFPLSKWRGSIFRSDHAGSPFKGYKCICTFESKTVMTFSYGDLPLHKFDINRAIHEASFPDLSSLPVRTYDLDLSPDEIIARLDSLPSLYAFDIEGGIPNPSKKVQPHLRFPNGITCVSFAPSASEAFIVPLQKHSIPDTVRIIRKMQEVLEDPSRGKILQNAMYDAFVLAWEFGILTRNIVWDTMVSGFELYPELPKSLETQTSIYTTQPYYKNEKSSEDLRTHWSYCCTDSCVTY